MSKSTNRHEVRPDAQLPPQKLVPQAHRQDGTAEVCAGSIHSSQDLHDGRIGTDLAHSSFRYDISPLWASSEAFSALVHDIQDHFKGAEYDLVVALDAIGFILGAALASSSGKGLVPLRKGGKLPLPAGRLESVEFHDYDHTEKRFEVVKDLIKPGK